MFLLPGDRVPEVTVADEQGRPVKLADTWRDRPVILFFLRHLG